jgi:hypothetical protein
MMLKGVGEDAPPLPVPCSSNWSKFCLTRLDRGDAAIHGSPMKSRTGAAIGKDFNQSILKMIIATSSARVKAVNSWKIAAMISFG